MARLKLPAVGCMLALTLCLPDAALAGKPPAEAPGRGPTVILDRLDFPAVLGGRKYEQHLRRVLRREVRNVNWGAGPDSRIEYRFEVAKLLVKQQDSVLHVTVEARGNLPRGKTVRSQLTFGGSPSRHSELIRKVLEIVARGVVARLAEMERVRRGHLPDARVGSHGS